MTDETNATMKKPNTKRHWTALAVARYYDQFGTACRARDLYPYVDEIHEKPDNLVSTLSALKNGDIIDYIVVESPTKSGGAKKTYAYYPTPITTEELRDLGEPTELPNHEPIPDGLNTEIPTARVSAEEADNVEPPRTGNHGLSYESSRSRRSKFTTRNYDTSGLDRPADYKLAGPDEDVSMNDDLTDAIVRADDALISAVERVYECSHCGDTFDDYRAYGGHVGNAHQGEPDETPSPTEDDLNDVIERAHVCEGCGQMFDGPRQLGGHRSGGCPPETDTPEYDIEVERDSFDAGTTDEPIGDLPEPDAPGAPTAGSYAGDVNWARIATRLERKAMDADDAGLTEIASAFSQFATLAVEGNLDKRMAYILLGTPVLELEDMAVVNA